MLEHSGSVWRCLYLFLKCWHTCTICGNELKFCCLYNYFCMQNGIVLYEPLKGFIAVHFIAHVPVLSREWDDNVSDTSMMNQPIVCCPHDDYIYKAKIVIKNFVCECRSVSWRNSLACWLHSERDVPLCPIMMLNDFSLVRMFDRQLSWSILPYIYKFFFVCMYISVSQIKNNTNCATNFSSLLCYSILQRTSHFLAGRKLCSWTMQFSMGVKS